MSQTGKVLVIDDEAGIRRGIQRVLMPEGYEVDLAADGQEGIAAILAGEYDVLLVDLKMPGHLDGLDVVRAALEKDPDVIAVVISAYATLDAAVQATRLGAYDFMAKPFTPDEVKMMVRKGMERRTLILERRRLMEEREANLLELSKERGRLKSVVNSMADGVLVVNQQGLVAYANPVARAILQHDKQIEGTDVFALLGQSSIGLALEQTLAAADPDCEFITREYDVDEKTTYMIKITPLRDGDQIMGAVLVQRDISRLKELDRMKSRFVSVVSHELKAPLAAIEGYLEVLLAGTVGDIPPKGLVMLERCRDRAASLQNLIKDILNITKIEAQAIIRNIEKISLSDVVGAILDLLKPNADQKAVTVVHAVPEGLPLISADKDDLERILTNILSNAIKYNRNGGSVHIAYRVESGQVLVSIRDTGIGIEKEHLDHLGKEFFRVRNEETSRIAGTGLGLSIVKKLVDFYHGRFQVESVRGEGSSFTLGFPIESEAASVQTSV